MARGHRLNTSIVLAAVHGLSGLFRVVSSRGRTFTLSPSSPLSPSLISNLASVDVKQSGQGLWMKAVVFRRSSTLPHSCSCCVAPWDHCSVLASLKKGKKRRERARGEGGGGSPVWNRQSSVYIHVPVLVRTCVGAGGSVKS